MAGRRMGSYLWLARHLSFYLPIQRWKRNLCRKKVKILWRVGSAGRPLSSNPHGSQIVIATGDA